MKPWQWLLLGGGVLAYFYRDQLRALVERPLDRAAPTESYANPARREVSSAEFWGDSQPTYEIAAYRTPTEYRF